MSSHQLHLYIADNGQLWAEDPVRKIAYRLQHSVGVTDYPPAPSVGQDQNQGAGPQGPKGSQAPSGPLETDGTIDPLVVAQVTIEAQNRFSVRLEVTAEGGDLLAKSLAGPNAGKSVNLTYGKWSE